jgi:proline iminopeptidase
MPLYSRVKQDPDTMKRPIMTPKVIAHFSQPGGENWTFDFRQQLSSISCPTLVTAGDIDPITPIEAVQELADHIPGDVLQMEIFPGCGHGVHRDDVRAFDVMKKFIAD